MAQYIMEKLADGMFGDGERQFPKLVNTRVCGIKEIVERIASNTTFREGEAQGVVTDLIQTITDMLANGNSVKIDGLGTFRPVLGLVDKEQRGAWQDSAERTTTGRNIKLKTVNFRPDVSLTRNVGSNMTLERLGDMTVRPKDESTLAERIAKARAFIAKEGFMRLADYADMTKLSKSAAWRELKKIVGDPASGITTTGRGTAKVYVAK